MKKITILLTILLFILYIYTFLWLFNSWLTNPYYSHGIVIPMISAFIIYKKLDKKNKKPNETSYTPGIYIFAFGLILYVIGFIQVFPFLSALSFLFTLSGLILYFYGKALMRSLLFPISYLIFAIPLPFLFVEQVAFLLQSISISFSPFLIGLFGIPVTTAGSEIQLQNQSFYIGLPCSGINTLISLLALTTIFIYILKCSPNKKIFLFCITIPIAIFANILRVTFIILIANQYGTETAMNFFHDVSSPLLFIIAFIFLILIARLMGCTLEVMRNSKT